MCFQLWAVRCLAPRHRSDKLIARTTIVFDVDVMAFRLYELRVLLMAATNRNYCDDYQHNEEKTDENSGRTA